ncbi:hypothetical protein [Nonomuraea jabiensis]|uniref:hypothetical protein n=1 Tax=Nonomuraea jabiensis TaxID=882448 RepID=UPI003D76646F
MQDADESIGDLAQSRVVGDVAASKLVVVGADVGVVQNGGGGLHMQGIDKPVVVDEAGMHGLDLPDWRVMGLVAA